MARTPGIRDDMRYGYAVGRVRVLEGKLLSRITFERLIDAVDLTEQKRILAETPMGRYLEGVQTAEDAERALEASLGDLYDEFLRHANLPAPVVTYFHVPHDYANLRAVVKAHLLGGDPGPLSALGSVPPEAYVAGGIGLPDDMRQLLHAWDESEERPAMDDVEAALDRVQFAALSGAARASKLGFLRELTRLRIDLANARVLVRSRAKGLLPGDIAARLLSGGSPSLEQLADKAARVSAEELAGLIWETHALPGMSEADLLDVQRFDLAADAVVAGRMLAARMSPGGADPVLAYVLAREAEVLLLRTAVAGRLAGLDSNAVRERVRERLS